MPDPPAFSVFKEMLLGKPAAASAAADAGSSPAAEVDAGEAQGPAGAPSSVARVRELERQLRERDEEIRVLTAMWRAPV